MQKVTWRHLTLVGALSATAAVPPNHLQAAEVTDDPVLLFRSPAYAVSFAKRLSGQ